ncbi:translation initiation factor IF-1 [Patescibacteria group bacterium]|nr:translation initiation factor IF-1 [Patescibacteria group bacterium]
MNNSPTKKIIKKEGQVIEALPSTFFKVRLDDGNEVLAVLSGKMRLHRITILPGDRVSVEMTPYDDKKGRIVYRLK